VETMPLILTAEFGPPRLDWVLSLKEAWRRHGGRWTKLKIMIIEERGAQCGICGSEKGPLHAHEEWEHADAAGSGLDDTHIQQALAVRQAQELHLPALMNSIRVKRGLSAIPIVPPRCVKPIVRALVDIKLLCQPCHVCKHSYDRRYMHHWCW